MYHFGSCLVPFANGAEDSMGGFLLNDQLKESRLELKEWIVLGQVTQWFFVNDLFQ